MKFEGILFIVGKQSTVPPFGTNRNHHVLLSDEAIWHGLTQLPGTPLFASNCLSAHDRTKEVGLIEKAFIIGDMFCISGELYTTNTLLLSIAASSIQPLGLSYDVLNAYYNELPDGTYKIGACTFIGATVLLQNKAAHKEDCLFWLV